MAPVPLRGTPCYPDFATWTAVRLAQVRGCAPGPDRQALLAQMHANACGLLDRAPTAWQQAHHRPGQPLAAVYPEQREGEEAPGADEAGRA